MCTVSYYRDENKLIITSNRDENINRSLAVAPQCELVNGSKLFFPKDPQAGGTWFAVHESGDVFVLLNGAAFKHIPNPPYKKSRGIILLNIASSKLNIYDEWDSIELTDIEPFTIVAYIKNTLFQLRWGGKAKELKKLNNAEPRIWSSATLYEPEIIIKRTIWFDLFVQKKNKQLDADDLIHFHTQTHSDDLENGVVINRNENMLTKSVTQFILEDKQFKLLHFDLITKTKTCLSELIR